MHSDQNCTYSKFEVLFSIENFRLSLFVVDWIKRWKKILFKLKKAVSYFSFRTSYPIWSQFFFGRSCSFESYFTSWRSVLPISRLYYFSNTHLAHWVFLTGRFALYKSHPVLLLSLLLLQFRIGLVALLTSLTMQNGGFRRKQWKKCICK